MINVKIKLCDEDCCNKYPAFNYSGIKKPIYCATHKKENMINVISIHCQELGCRVGQIF